MAQDVTIAGASYTDVPSINVPKTGGGFATFVDSNEIGGASNIEDGTGTGSVQVVGCDAGGNYSFAEGEGSETNGEASHAEGYQTLAYGFASHAEGETTTAAGSDSHAEGFGTYAGFMAHAEGWYSRAESSYQHVQGKCNIADNADTYAHIVGNGASANSRSNAHTLDWNGNAWFEGDVYVGSTSGTNKDAGSKKLATEPTIKTTMDSVAVAGTQYYLGTQTTVSVVLPSSASVGQIISVCFYSGSTAATLSITGTTIGDVVVPSTNQRVEVNMLWDGTYWAIVSNVMAVTV